jgi:hypothetical protein
MENLTETQTRVMRWIGKGWHARRSHGSSVEINGQRVCNADTMMVLCRKELAQQEADGTWTATERGKALVAQLGI